MDLILDILLTLSVLGTTTICAAPIVSSMAPEARWLTKMALSFVLGFTLITLAGIFSAFLGVNPMMLQGGVVLAGFGLFLHDWKKIAGVGGGRLDREDWTALAIGSFYLLLCLFFFDRIIIWMGGDALAHAEIIRMLLDGKTVPVSVPPLGSYWEYYPKGFHFFSYPWARAFPILDVLRTIPILITAVTPLLLYSIAREMGRREEAIYAFILACFVFPAHYSYLIWAGYPSVTAEMLLVAALLSVLVEKRLLPILLLGVLFSHGRLLALACGVLLLWMAVTPLSRYRLTTRACYAALVTVACITVGIAAGLAISAHRPEFLISIITNQNLAGEYAARWFPAFLALFGAVIAFSRRDRIDLLALSWAGSVALIVLLADTGPVSFVGSADRLLLGLYLPLSLLAASVLSKMDVAGPRVRAGFMLVLLFSGALGMGAVFHSYEGSWAIPQEDYKAIMWLGEQNYSDALCINLDETGGWVYPLTGMQVAYPRTMTEAMAPFDWNLKQKIITDPGSLDAIKALRRSGYNRSLIYISNVSLSRPGYVPPFAEYLGVYPAVNLSFPEESYDLIYSRGAYIYGFPKGAFSSEISKHRNTVRRITESPDIKENDIERFRVESKYVLAHQVLMISM